MWARGTKGTEVPGVRSEESCSHNTQPGSGLLWRLMGNSASPCCPCLPLLSPQVPMAGEAWQTWLNIDVQSADQHGQAVVLTCCLVCRGAQPAWRCRASCNCWGETGAPACPCRSWWPSQAGCAGTSRMTPSRCSPWSRLCWTAISACTSWTMRMWPWCAPACWPSRNSTRPPVGCWR